MKAYVVGGAVRDRLLGGTVSDRDWVVVGATPQELLAAGYTPVGRDFPVFLHPTTREQHALARTERKAGRGYHGFVFHAAPDVTLQQDLARRDLTINAIAEDPDSGELIDPFGGRRDIHDRVLRHVSDAFAEDPVRLLRLARFAARWPDRLRYLGTDERGAEAVTKLHFPGLDPAAARWLVERRRVAAVGLDTASIDPGTSQRFESHQVLFAAEIPAFENLAALDRLPPTGATLIALPMKIAGGSGGPLRAVAILPSAK